MIGTTCYVLNVGGTSWRLADAGEPGAKPASVVRVVGGMAHVRPDDSDACLVVPAAAVMRYVPTFTAEKITPIRKVKPLKREADSDEIEGQKDDGTGQNAADS